jgi:hypothetical protein
MTILYAASSPLATDILPYVISACMYRVFGVRNKLVHYLLNTHFFIWFVE